MGIEKMVLREGNGKDFPVAGNIVTCHYTGCLNNQKGKNFESSDPGKPFVFTIGIGQVIKCWDEGVVTMSVGEKATLTCSPEYGYGDEDVGSVIPSNSTLCFEIELLKIDLVSNSTARSSNVLPLFSVKRMFWYI